MNVNKCVCAMNLVQYSCMEVNKIDSFHIWLLQLIFTIVSYTMYCMLFLSNYHFPGMCWFCYIIATGSGDTYPCQLNQCSGKVIDFHVNCNKESNSVQVQWSAPEDSLFGFCIQYQCSTDPNLEYCTSKTQQVYNKSCVSCLHDIVW